MKKKSLLILLQPLTNHHTMESKPSGVNTTKEILTLNKHNNENYLIRELKKNPILNFLIKFPSNRNNKNTKLQFVGIVTRRKFKLTQDIILLRLSYGNANYAWFLEQSERTGEWLLHTEFSRSSLGIAISIKNKRFTLEYLNYYGFSSIQRYFIESHLQQKVIELKTIQKNIDAFLFLWEQFVIYKENNPETCGRLYNASTFHLSYGESVSQPVILQLLGKRASYYGNHRFCMKKVSKWNTAIEEAQLIIEYVNTHTVGDFRKALRKAFGNSQPMNYLKKLLEEPNFKNQKISQFVSDVLQNPVIKIQQLHVLKLYDMIRTVLNLPVYSRSNIKRYYQGDLEMNSTMRYQIAKKRKLNNNTIKNNVKKPKNNINQYINHIGILPNGRIGKINNILNQGNNYTVLLSPLNNNTPYVFMGNYRKVLKNIKEFIHYKYYQNKKGLYNNLLVNITNVGKINNLNMYFATFNYTYPNMTAMPRKTITANSLANLKKILDRTINNRVKRNTANRIYKNSKMNSNNNYNSNRSRSYTSNNKNYNNYKYNSNENFGAHGALN